MRHYRTTHQCVFWTFLSYWLSQAAAASTDRIRTGWHERVTPAPAAALPRQANPPPTSTPPLHQRSPTTPQARLSVPLTAHVSSPPTTSFPCVTDLSSTSRTIPLLSLPTFVPPTETRRFDSSRAKPSACIS